MALADYTIIRKIGEGGAGFTYLVRDAAGTEHCMKEFRFGMKRGEENTFKARELFEREAKTIRSLNHPQIPRYTDFFAEGTDNEERLYLIMEHIEGDTLEELIKKQRFNENDALGIAKKVNNILDYLHGFSPPIIHRDIKPKNLIQTSDGIIKLVDFGSVSDKILKETGRTFTRIGTFGFAAPELFYGEPVPASDIYSLGATLVFLLSGGIDPSKMMNSKHRMDFRGKINVSKKTENLLWDMTEPDLEKRVKTTEELKQRLYGNGTTAIQAYKTGDEIAIHYDDIERTYHRTFWRRWDLSMILEKFNAIFTGIKSVANDYGKEMETHPIEIHIAYAGKSCNVRSPEEAFAILPKKSQQRDGLASVSCNLSTSDKSITGKMVYHLGSGVHSHVGGYGPSSEYCIQTDLHVEGFAARDRAQYERIYGIFERR